MVCRVRERAKLLVSGDTIVKEAKQRALEILSQAKSRSQEIKNATSSYVDRMLADAEKYFENGLQDVKRTTQAINRVKNGGKNNTEDEQ